MTRPREWSLLAAATVVLAGCAAARPSAALVTLPRTLVEELTAADGTIYRLQVSLPRDYDRRSDRFPLVVTLDPEFSFAIVRNVVEHLSDRGALPEAIVVGVGHPGGIEGAGWLQRYRTQRTRDYTPTRSDVGYPDGIQQVSGGAPQFLRFLEERLVPFLEQRFRTVPGDRTLIGHSYGGLFAGYAILSRPDLFSRAILVSPSLWYDQRFLFRFEEAHHDALDGRAIRLFLAAGAREGVSVDGDIAGDVARFARILQGPAGAERAVTFVILEGETHDSVFPAAVTRGLRAVFEGR